MINAAPISTDTASPLPKPCPSTTLLAALGPQPLLCFSIYFLTAAPSLFFPFSSGQVHPLAHPASAQALDNPGSLRCQSIPPPSNRASTAKTATGIPQTASKQLIPKTSILSDYTHYQSTLQLQSASLFSVDGLSKRKPNRTPHSPPETDQRQLAAPLLYSRIINHSPLLLLQPTKLVYLYFFKLTPFHPRSSYNPRHPHLCTSMNPSDASRCLTTSWLRSLPSTLVLCA